MNPKRWTYKQKNTALLVGVLLLSVVGYWAAFGKTLHLWQENQRLRAQSQLTNNIEAQVQQMQQKIMQLESFYATTQGSTNSYHEEILRQVSSFCLKNNLLIREFPPATQHEETQYLVETNKVTVEGGFKNMVKLIYDLEQVAKTGRVASVTFEAGPDRKTRQYRLEAHIIIQNIKANGK